MRYQHLLVEFQGPVARVALNRPEVRNSLDETTLSELTHCFTGFGKNATLRAVVLRGLGKDFCAGADVRWMRRAADYSPAKNRKDAYQLVKMIRAIDECPFPVIASIHGGVYGGGLGLVAACDIVIAEENTALCFSECRLGILPAVVSSFVLPKVGLGQVRRLYLTAQVFDAGLAKEIGLVHEILPKSKLDARVDGYIRDILRCAPGAVRKAKGYLRKMAELSRSRRLRFSVETLVQARSSLEGREGFAAFLEKRPAHWVLQG